MTETSLAPREGGLVVLRYLVSVLVGGLLLMFMLQRALDGINAPLAFPLSMAAALVVGLPLALWMRRKGRRRFHHALAIGLILGLVPWGVLSAVSSLLETFWCMATGVGVAVTAWLALRLQTLSLRFAPPKARVPATLAVAALTLALGLTCSKVANLLLYGPTPSPGSEVMVAAFEVPLPTPEARSQFLILLKQVAATHGLHVDVADQTYLKEISRTMPQAARTISAGVWRGTKDNWYEAGVTDLSHPGYVWITFHRGEDPAAATRFRDAIMGKVAARWPNVRTLPVLPGNRIPSRDSLIVTPAGYRLKASEAALFDLSLTSPQVAQDATAPGAPPP